MYNSFSDYEEAIKQFNEALMEVSKECRHEMVQYVGFTETYHFCTKCDKKDYNYKEPTYPFLSYP